MNHLAFGTLPNSKDLSAFSLPDPKPQAHEVLVRAVYGGLSPLSGWYFNNRLNQPDDKRLVLVGTLVGKIVEVGEGVRDELSVGTTITTWTPMGGERSEAFQEYVVVPENCATKIPCNVTLPQAAAVSDSFVTAYDALRTEMGLAIPFKPTARAREREEVVVVWGGASVTGIYAIQILRVAGYKRIVAIASKKHHAYLASLGASLGASHTVSYSSPTVVQDVLSLLPPGKTHVDAVLDCIADANLTLPHVARLVEKGSVVGVLIPVRAGGRGKVDSVVSAVPDEVRDLFEEGVKVVGLTSFMYESRDSEMARTLQPVIVRDWLASGAVQPAPHRLVRGANVVERLGRGLHELKEGTVRGERLIVEMQR